MAPPFLMQRRQIAIKVEGAEGVDSVPALADVITPAYDIEYSPTVEMFEREILQSSFSRVPQIAGERSAVIRWSTELKGSGVAGTAPPNLGEALQGCGFSETIDPGVSVTYVPVSVSIPSFTVEVREGAVGTEARSMKIVGARGTVTFEAVKGDVVLATFEFTGKYIEPLDTAIALFVPVLGPTPNPIAFLNAAFSFSGVGTLKIQNVSLDIGNNIVLRNSANDPTGNLSAQLVGRTPVGSTDPETELIATFNPYDLWTTNAEGILTYALTGSAGNIVTVNVPAAQVIGVSEADRDGIQINTLDLQLNQGSVDGDDELELVMT